MGWVRGLTDEAKVDCEGVKAFLESFREKPGKSGISITCERLKWVRNGWAGNLELPAATDVFIIHGAGGSGETTTGVAIFRG